jgi:hypothetical protein
MIRQSKALALACTLALGWAATYSPTALATLLKCQLDDVQITAIQSQDPNPDSETQQVLAILEDAYPISATACLGVFEGNDEIGDIGDNLGFFNHPLCQGSCRMSLF